jgi:hypothetical protein
MKTSSRIGFNNLLSEFLPNAGYFFSLLKMKKIKTIFKVLTVKRAEVKFGVDHIIWTSTVILFLRMNVYR